MTNSISILCGAGLIGAIALLASPNPAVGAPITSSVGIWPPRAADMVNVDSWNVAQSSNLVFDQMGRHVVMQVPADKYLVVTNFEVYGLAKNILGDPYFCQFALTQEDWQGAPEVKHSFAGWGGDHELLHGGDILNQSLTWAAGPFRSSAVGLVFEPGSRVVLGNTQKPFLCEYNLVGYWLDG